MGRPELVLMGRTAGAFGVKGELKVFSYAEDPGVFPASGVFYVGPNPESARPYTLESLRPHAGRLLFRVRELADREAAQALAGRFVYLPRQALPAAGPDEYYWADLVGARVLTPEGRELGRVQAVRDHGASELWEVRSPQGREALIPAVEGVVREMDLEAGRVVVAPPEGLLAAQGWPEEEDQPLVAGPEPGGGG
jgi:16S rRNA processing protein RimM